MSSINASNTAKAAIFNRLRSMRSKPDQSTPQLVWQPRKCETGADRLAQLNTALEASHAEVILTHEADWQSHLKAVSQRDALTHWAVSTQPYITDALSALATELPDATWTDFQSDGSGSIKSRLFHETDAALTMASAALADTGTLVLIPGEQEPRSLSLIPPVHVVLLRSSTIYDNYTDWLSEQPWPLQSMPTNVILVSGPSKTADIQQTLAYGAHGPKALIVLVLQDV